MMVAGVVASVVAGHAAMDAMEYPDSAPRAAHLTATGHGYWPVAIVVGLLAGLVALLGAAGDHELLARGSVRPVAARLVVAAAASYVALETTERIVAHLPWSAVAPSPDLAIGIAVQGLTATVVSILLCWVARAMARMIAVAVRRPRPQAAKWSSAGPAVVTSRPQRPPAARGPPLIAW